MNVEGLTPFRVVARRLSMVGQGNLSPATISRWVHLAGKAAKDTIEIAQEFSPLWFGVLSIDGKSIKVGGIEHTLLLAVDIKSQDIVHALFVTQESYQNAKRFIRDIREKIGYPLEAAVIDLRPGLLRALREVYPCVPVQACVIHLVRQVKKRLPKLKGKKGSQANRELRAIIHKLFFSPTLDEALASFHTIQISPETITSLKI
ncbi:MAG: transposase [Actinomycetota bacterium]|nr:transposase [Actinomycetota bacterium]